MKAIRDGDAVAIVKDNFVDLQESPSVWVTLDDDQVALLNAMFAEDTADNIIVALEEAEII